MLSKEKTCQKNQKYDFISIFVMCKFMKKDCAVTLTLYIKTNSIGYFIPICHYEFIECAGECLRSSKPCLCILKTKSLKT